MTDPRSIPTHRLANWSLALLAAVVVTIHAVGRPSDSTTGWLKIVDAFYDLVTTGVLLALLFAVGRRILNSIPLGEALPRDRVLFAFGIGAGVTSSFILVLGLLPAYSPFVFVPLAAVVAALLRRELAELAALGRRVAELPLNRASPLGLLAAIVLATVGAVLLITAIAPEVGYDALVYHVRGPEQFVAAGRIFRPPHNAHLPFVSLGHFLSIPLLAVGAEAGPALLNLAFGVLVILSTWSMAHRLFDRTVAVFVMITIWGSTVILFDASRANVDLALTFFLSLGTYAVLHSYVWRAPVHFLYVGAALIGFGCGTKYHGLFWIVAVAPIVLLALRTVVAEPLARLRHLFLLGALTVLSFAPWLVKNWILFGAPLSPFLTESVLPPWLALIAGTSAIPATIPEKSFDLFGPLRAPFNLWDLFVAPVRISTGAEAVFYYMSPFLLLLPLCLLRLRERPWHGLLIPSLGYLIVMLVPFPRTNIRYLIPALPALSILVSALVVQGVDRSIPSRVREWLLCALAFLPLYGLAIASTGLLQLSKPDLYLDPRRSRDDYVATVAPGVRNVEQMLERHVSSRDTVLFIFEARGFATQGTIIQDDVLLNWPLLLGVIGRERCLVVTQPRFMLVNLNGPYYWSTRGLRPEDLFWAELEDHVSRCLDLLEEGDGVFLYRRRSYASR
jgi:hypothetical protein